MPVFFRSIKKQPTLRCLFFRNGPESTLLSKGTLDFIYAIILLLYIYICLHNVSQLLHRFLIDTKITSLHIFHRSPALPKHAGVWPSKSRRDKWPTWRNFKYMFNTSVEEMFFLFFFSNFSILESVRSCCVSKVLPLMFRFRQLESKNCDDWGGSSKNLSWLLLHRRCKRLRAKSLKRFMQKTKSMRISKRCLCVGKTNFHNMHNLLCALGVDVS